MLDLKNTGSERLNRIIVADGHRRLRNDRARVGLWDDEMNRRARYLHSGLKSLAVRIETGKRWQQGGMNVEHAALPTQHEVRRQQPHEAAQTNQFHAMFVEDRLERALEGGTIIPVWTVVDHRRWNRLRIGASEPGRTRQGHHRQLHV